MAELYPGLCLDDLSSDDDDDEAENVTIPPITVTAVTVDAASDDVDDNDATEDDSSSRPPQGVSVDMWKKFQDLQQGRRTILQRSTNRRRRGKKDPVKQPDVTQDPPQPDSSISLSDNSQKGNSSCERSTAEASSSSAKVSTSQSKPKCEKWADFKPFLNVNDHLKGTDKGKYAPKTGLEKQIDAALSEGDYRTAESLSDDLCTRQFGETINDAIEAKRYAEKRKKEEEIKAAKKKKKLNWGFQHKQRWETKGNM